MAVGGAGVGDAGRRVAVAVGARLVGVGGIGGTGVQAGVSVGATVGVSVGTTVTVAVAVCSGVGLHGSVGVAEGLGVLVGVGVTVGERATRESRGQVQLMVVIIATNSMPRVASLPLISCTLLFMPVRRARELVGTFVNCSGSASSRALRAQNTSFHYLMDTKVILMNCPAWLQSTMFTCSSSESGTGLAPLSTMSRMKGWCALFWSGESGENPHLPGE